MKNAKTNSFFKNVRTYFQEYCNCTGVYGFRYFAEKRTVFEKIWWFVAFVICLSACVVSIVIVYRKWEQSPVIVSFANRGTPIYRIPFPAVTVCPEAKSSTNKFNYTKLMHKKLDSNTLTPSEDILFGYMSLVCDYFPDFNYTNYTTFSEDFYDTIDKVKPGFPIRHCSFRRQDMNCSTIFKPIITDEGVCYTFNMLERTEIFRENVIHFKDYHNFNRHSTSWSSETGYNNDAGLLPYPRRALLAGVKKGLEFTLTTSHDDLDYACKDSLQGYKVLVHTPTSIPRPGDKYFRIPLDQSVVAAISPSMITTSDSVKTYSTSRRRCYFPSERHLKFFKIYNHENCRLECLANYTLNRCGCVNFFMPRENGTKLCGTANLECVVQAEIDRQMRNLRGKIVLKKDPRKISSINCDCLPTCTHLSYNVETSQTDWEWKKWLGAFRIPTSDNHSHWSSITLFFKSNEFINSERNELYGPIDFLANFGGLLGLFTGFTVLSVVEILYFLTVRIVCNKKMYGKWAGEGT